jgi:5-methylcytosine-specific restriction endonuclease McrA
MTQTPEERRAYLKIYRQGPKYKAYMKAYQQTPECKAKVMAYKQTPKFKARITAYEQTPERKAYVRASHRVRQQMLRRAILEHYGNCCVCCGETIPEFLAIDHINGGGKKHRKETGSNFYAWIIKNGFPKDLQILCHNCNLAKGFYGECPHKTSK